MPRKGAVIYTFAKGVDFPSISTIEFKKVGIFCFSFYWDTLFGVTVSLFRVYFVLNKMPKNNLGYAVTIQYYFLNPVKEI